MHYFGARPAKEQYSPKPHTPRPGWSYRAARRNAAADMQWPNRYRWRRVMAALRAKVAAMTKGKVVETAGA